MKRITEKKHLYQFNVEETIELVRQYVRAHYNENITTDMHNVEFYGSANGISVVVTDVVK